MSMHPGPIMLYNRLQPVRFPAAEVIERCAARNIPMYRTDVNGAVHAVSDGHKWRIGSEQLAIENNSSWFYRYARNSDELTGGAKLIAMSKR